MMRVFQIHNRYREPGGEDLVVDAEAQLLESHGHAVAQYTVDNPTSRLASGRALLLAPWNRMAAAEVREAVAAFGADVVHVHNTWFKLSPAVVSAAHEFAPVVMTLHNYRLVCANAQLLRDGAPCRLCVDGSIWNGIIHSCYRDPLSSTLAVGTIATGRFAVWRDSVDLFLALSGFATLIFKSTGISPSRLVVKDNFVGDPGPRPLPATGSREVLFVGRLSEEKGIPQLLDNRQLIEAAGLSLTVVGDGPLRRDVEAAVGDNYLGSLSGSAVAQRLLRARALLFPSIIYEGQPRIVLEAFAAGLPVLGGTQGALGELLSVEPSEWLFEPRQNWDEAISTVSSDAKVKEGSFRARQIWEKRFGPDSAIANLTTAYQKAIDAHHHGHLGVSQ